MIPRAIPRASSLLLPPGRRGAPPPAEDRRRSIRARLQRARKHIRPTLRRINVAVTNSAATVGRIDESQRDYDLMIQLILGIGIPKKRASADRVQVPVGAPEVRDTVGDHRR